MSMGFLLGAMVAQEGGSGQLIEPSISGQKAPGKALI